MISIADALDYEVRSSRWTRSLNNPILQNLAARYFAWRVSRKFKRYEYNQLRAAKIRISHLHFKGFTSP